MSAIALSLHHFCLFPVDNVILPSGRLPSNDKTYNVFSRFLWMLHNGFLSQCAYRKRNSDCRRRIKQNKKTRTKRGVSTMETRNLFHIVNNVADKVRLTIKGWFAEPPRQPIDYSKADSWAFLADTSTAGDDAPADVFFISPTACLGRYEPYYLDLSNTQERAALRKVIRMEKGIYDARSRFFAPYYRQAGFEVYSFDKAFREECIEEAHQDIEDAFDYYMEHYNEGRPFIIAGFSQGADHVLRLLKARTGDMRIARQLIAAYAIGWVITEKEMRKYPQLRFAGRADDTGVIVAFNSEAEGVHDSPILPRGIHALAINPLNWRTDGTVADRSLNKGACFVSPDGTVESEYPALTGAYIDTERGALKCTDISPKRFPGKLYDDGIFHIYDYRFFYRNLQENVNVRIEAYLKEQKKKPHEAA